MITRIAIVAALSITLLLSSLLLPSLARQETIGVQESAPQESQLNKEIRGFLESKNSPLAQETDLLLTQKHWKLLIAISAIESQYCKRQLSFNCWGIGGDAAYRHYSSFAEALVDANDLIERWQQRGRWLTIDDMNCSYVVPCNPNWVRVVTLNLKTLDDIIARTTSTVIADDNR